MLSVVKGEAIASTNGFAGTMWAGEGKIGSNGIPSISSYVHDQMARDHDYRTEAPFDSLPAAGLPSRTDVKLWPRTASGWIIEGYLS